MRQDDNEALQKLIGCHPNCVPETSLRQLLRISRKLGEALRWDILRNLNGQPKPSEQDMHEETIQQILALMEAYERAWLAINYRLENWGEPYEPYFDIQTLCELRYHAHQWNEGNTAAFLGAHAVSARQSKLAKRHRADALQELIIDILNDDPLLPPKAVLWKLHERQGRGVILSVHGDNVEWRGKNRQIKTTSTDAIEDRFYRAKKNFPR